MSRRTTLVLVALSALLLAATLYGWLESYRPLYVRSQHGKLLFLFVDPYSYPQFSALDKNELERAVFYNRQKAQVDANWAGFEFFHETYITLFAIPYPYLAILTAGLTAYAIHFHRRSRFRSVHNRCLTCGYDLCATTTGRCPECGTPSTTATQ